VEPETALAPLDFVKAEATPFPKGHVAIATSWSYPRSAYALHMRYEKENTRGPVRFQLDLQAELDTQKAPAASNTTKAAKPKTATKTPTKAPAKARATRKKRSAKPEKGESS